MENEKTKKNMSLSDAVKACHLLCILPPLIDSFADKKSCACTPYYRRTTADERYQTKDYRFQSVTLDPFLCRMAGTFDDNLQVVLTLRLKFQNFATQLHAFESVKSVRYFTLFLSRQGEFINASTVGPKVKYYVNSRDDPPWRSDER